MCQGAPAPSGAFNTLFQKARSWSSAQVPRGGGLPVLPVAPRAGAPSALLRPPFLPGSAHTRDPIQATPFAHKGGIKPLCAVLCCVILSLVCVTGNCALREHPAPPGALRRGHNQCLWPRWGNIKGVPRAARRSGCRRPLSGIPRKSGVLRNENPAFFVLGVVWRMAEPRNTNAESLMMSSLRSSPKSLRSRSMA